MTSFPENLCEDLIEKIWFIFHSCDGVTPSFQGEKTCQQCHSFPHPPPLPFLKVWEIYFVGKKGRNLSVVLKCSPPLCFSSAFASSGPAAHLYDAKSLIQDRQCHFELLFFEVAIPCFCLSFPSTLPCRLAVSPGIRRRHWTDYNAEERQSGSGLFPATS